MSKEDWAGASGLVYAIVREEFRSYASLQGIYELSSSMKKATHSALNSNINFQLAFSEFIGEASIEAYKDYLEPFLGQILKSSLSSNKRVLVVEQKFGRDLLTILNRGIEKLDAIVESEYKYDYISNFVNPKIANERLNIIKTPLTFFSPPPDIVYDGILVESALQHLNHDEVYDFLLRAVGWLKQESSDKASPKVVSFRLKKSQNGTVYVSTSGVGERFFTTWTDDEIMELIRVLEQAGARLVSQSTDVHKDSQRGAPSFEHLVFTVASV